VYIATCSHKGQRGRWNICSGCCSGGDCWPGGSYWEALRTREQVKIQPLERKQGKGLGDISIYEPQSAASHHPQLTFQV